MTARQQRSTNRRICKRLSREIWTNFSSRSGSIVPSRSRGRFTIAVAGPFMVPTRDKWKSRRAPSRRKGATWIGLLLIPQLLEATGTFLRRWTRSAAAAARSQRRVCHFTRRDVSYLFNETRVYLVRWLCVLLLGYTLGQKDSSGILLKVFRILYTEYFAHFVNGVYFVNVQYLSWIVEQFRIDSLIFAILEQM